MLEQFINSVEQMRVAQKHYFKTSNHARKTKEPADYQVAKDALLIAKNLESKVDAALPRIIEQNLLKQ